MGNAMEEPIARWYAKMTGKTVEHVPMLHGKEPWMLGSLDRIATDRYLNKTVVEIKRPTAWTRKEWADGVPPRYVCQSTWYAGISGIHDVDVCAAIGDDEPIIYHVPYDAGLFDTMVDVARTFWHEV
jgi:predicted phage-related endonuclease